MLQQSLAGRISTATMALAFSATMVSPAWAQGITLPKGTPIVVAFETALSSRTAHDGERVRCRVAQPVVENGVVIIPMGTPVFGHVTAVHKPAVYGVNARIQLLMDPIRVDNRTVPIGFHTRGPGVSGNTAGAAAATVGGAVLLGPVGLIGGLFVRGKNISVKPGQTMTVTTDDAVTFPNK